MPSGTLLDFSDLPEGTIAPDPESEAALHAVLSALGQVVGERPGPGDAPAAASPATSANPADHLLSDLAHALSGAGGHPCGTRARRRGPD